MRDGMAFNALGLNFLVRSSTLPAIETFANEFASTVFFCYTDLPGQKKLLIPPGALPLADIPNPSGVKNKALYLPTSQK
jgi:hypothetical protein